MHEELITIPFYFGTWHITGWKLVGFLGIFLFGGRWVVQMAASKLARKVVMPRLFWYMSMAGSLLLVAYFTFGKNDSVGIAANLFPFLVAAYNLYLDITHQKLNGQSESGETETS